MEYLKVNGTEYPAHFCGKQIDRDWDGRASKTVTLAMPYAQAVQLFVDGLRWGIVRREAGADDAAQEQDCSGYCVAGPITDNRDGTLSIKMGSYTQLEQALRELEEETGYRCDHLEYLMSVNTTIAFCDEALDIFLARDLKKTHQHLDPDEEIEVEAWELSDLLKRIYAGELTDGKTVSAILAYACKAGQK